MVVYSLTVLLKIFFKKMFTEYGDGHYSWALFPKLINLLLLIDIMMLKKVLKNQINNSIRIFLSFSTCPAQVPDPAALILLHMVYVFLVGVLLINFLIALLSYSVAEVLTYKNIIIKVFLAAQKLSNVALVLAILDKIVILLLIWFGF